MTTVPSAVGRRLEPVAVDVPDLWADLAQVVLAERKVVERLAIHVHDEAVADRLNRVTLCV